MASSLDDVDDPRGFLMNKEVLAWHFVGDTLRDGRPVPANGVVLKHKGKLELCESGLHASERLIDALPYAPGPILCRVQMGGAIKKDYGKLVASKRTIIWRVNLTNVLQKFARRCALDAAHLWDVPIVVRQYLETGDESIKDEAIFAAKKAANTAAMSAVWAAAWDARHLTATAPAWAAARDAASDAAWAVAWNEANNATRDAPNDSTRNAVWDEVWDAARDAVRSVQNTRLTEMAMALAPESIDGVIT